MRSISNYRYAVAAGLAIAAAVPLACQAGVNTWTGGGPTGGDIRHIEFNPQDVEVVFATTPGGLYQSTDKGGAWTLVNASVGSTPFAIDPNTPQIMYFVDPNGSLTRSSDSGVTISSVDNWVGGTSTAVAISADQSVIYAGTADQGVVRSNDGGATWHIAHGNTAGSMLPQVLDAFASVDGVFVDPTDASVAYATYAGFALGVYRTRDAGAHWSLRTSGMPANVGVTGLAIDPTDTQKLYAATDAGVYYSADQGDTWHAATTPIDFDGTGAASTVALDPKNPATLYAGTFGGGMFKSIDSGQNWILSNNGLSPSAVRGIAVHPSDGTTVLAATTEGVALSANAGQNWTDSDGGIVASDVVALASDPVLTGTLLASTTGIHRSTKAGSSWSEITDIAATALVFDPNTSGVVYAASNGVQKSIDGGISYTSVLSGVATDMLAVSPLDSSVFALDSKGLTLYHSANGDPPWPAVGTDIVDSQPLALIVDNTTPDTLYIGTSKSGAFKSIDGGATWSALTTLNGNAVTSLAQDPTDGSILYAATENGVFRSSDHGDNWSAAGALDAIGAVTIAPTAPEILYGTSSAGTGILRSLDSGATWAAIPVGNPVSWAARSTALDPVVRYRVYAATETSGVQVIDIAHDLQASINGPTSVGENANFEYTSTITNAGPGDAPRVSITQSIPTDNATFVSAVPDQGTCTPPSGALLTCDLGTLVEGASMSVLVTMTSTDRGVLSSSVTVSGFDKELAQADNDATAPPAQVTQLYDLVASVTAPATVQVGNDVTYTATATNNGPNNAGNVSLVATTPSGTTFVSATTTLRCSRVDLVLTCNAGSLAPGESATIDVTYSADQSGALTATLDASAGSGTDSDPSNNSASATTTGSSSSSGGGGGALDPFALLALLALNARRRSTASPAKSA